MTTPQSGGYARCSAEGCTDRRYGKGLCRRHYDRERERHRHRRRDDTLLRNRARNRAIVRLIDAHPDEFADLFADEREKVEAEAAALEEAARSMVHEPLTDPAPRTSTSPTSSRSASPTPQPAPRVRLLTGPRPADQQIADRIRTDVGRCSRCHTYHDAGHRCPECAAQKEGTA